MMYRMGPGLRIAFVLLASTVCLVGATAAIAYAQQTPGLGAGGQDIVKSHPELWVVVAGVLVTVGINLEQLRRVRADVHEIRKQRDDDDGRMDRMAAKLQHIEDLLEYLKIRRRVDREELARGGSEV